MKTLFRVLSLMAYIIIGSSCKTKPYVMLAETEDKLEKKCIDSEVVAEIIHNPLEFNFRDETAEKDIMMATCINGDLVLNGSYASLYLPNLQIIYGNLYVYGENLESLSLPYLEYVSGRLVLGSRAFPAKSLTSVVLPRLKEVGGELIIEHTLKLKELSLDTLMGIGGVRLRHNALLGQVKLAKLKTLTNSLIVSNNPQLEWVQFYNISASEPFVYVQNNPKLADCSFDPLRRLLIPEAKSKEASQESAEDEEEDFVADIIIKDVSKSGTCPKHEPGFWEGVLALVGL